MSKIDESMESMLDTFVFECTELLENLDDILMRTENDELTADDIAEIFRVMHTIKGSAAMMGLQNMSVLAHAVEDLFYIIREDPTVSYDKPALYELLFTSSDCLKNEIEMLSDESVPLTNFDELVSKIHTFADNMKNKDNKTQNVSLQDIDIFPEGEDEDIRTFLVRFDEKCAMPSIRAMILINSLSSVGELVSTIPADLDEESSSDFIKANGIYIKIKCESTAGVLSVLSGGLDVESVKEMKRPPKVGDGVYLFEVRFKESCTMPSIRAMVLINSLTEKGSIVSVLPDDLDAENADDIIKTQGLKIYLRTDNAEAVLDILKEGLDVESAIQVTDEKKSDSNAENVQNIEKQQPEQIEQKKAPAPATGQTTAGTGNIISVKLEKLDRLLDLVGEIVITESSVTSSPDIKKIKKEMEHFSKASRELKKLTDELQDIVMSIRMVPIQSVFQKMNRVVRDMNKKLGKNVKLELVGSDTEVDKSVIDILGDPLMHIVRNAVDHGIETPEERKAAEKTEEPTVILSAGYDNGEVVISCKDNGAGMNPQKLLEKAKKNGLLKKPENEYTKEECYNFVMTAGFSTNETITEFSGRGVGLDVVRKNIEKVGGKMSIASELGKGSTFIIRIPLSLSIIDVLGVSANGGDFSVPTSTIVEIFRAKQSQLIKDHQGNDLIMMRDKCFRVVRISEYFGIEGENIPFTEGIMLRCREKEHEAVIFVDMLTFDQQVVVKPFSPLLDKYDLKDRGLSGCSILADGSITLIIDINGLFSSCGIMSDEEQTVSGG